MDRFPEQVHTDDVELWAEDDEIVLFRAGSGTTYELTPPEARELGLALLELAHHCDGLQP